MIWLQWLADFAINQDGANYKKIKSKCFHPSVLVLLEL